MSNSNSLKLQKQWSSRPADQCFESFEEVHKYNLEKQSLTRFATVNLGELSVKAIDDDKDIALEACGKELTLTNYSFSKLAELSNLSPEMLRKLPAPMVCDVLNYGMRNLGANSVDSENLEAWETDQSGRAVNTNAKLIYESNGSDILKTVTGPNYHWLSDSVLSKFMLDLAGEFNLLPAPKTTNGDVNHRGLYAGPSDCFLFASDMDKPVLTFADSPIYRGIMIWNGFGRTFGGVGFDFAGICCNYSIHQYTEKFSFNLRHSAKFKEKFNPLEIIQQAREYFNGSTVDHENFLRLATTKVLGDSDDTVKETLLKLREPLLGKKTVDHIIELAPMQEKIYGNPRTVWAIGNVITELGRDRPTASARSGYMEAAKSVFAMAQ